MEAGNQVVNTGDHIIFGATHTMVVSAQPTLPQRFALFRLSFTIRLYMSGTLLRDGPTGTYKNGVHKLQLRFLWINVVTCHSHTIDTLRQTSGTFVNKPTLLAFE